MLEHWQQTQLDGPSPKPTVLCHGNYLQRVKIIARNLQNSPKIRNTLEQGICTIITHLASEVNISKHARPDDSAVDDAWTCSGCHFVPPYDEANPLVFNTSGKCQDLQGLQVTIVVTGRVPIDVGKGERFWVRPSCKELGLFE
jgi:hypothetical protein